ncbi:MAG: hypothetical protein IT537_06610 [Hyphomicrobiales bacterium]|nr:hypothetical protein [Hyphomicrobiales bacterium]
MDKVVVKTRVPELGVPLTMAVRLGQLLFISGIPPFSEDFAAELRAARAAQEPPPPFPDLPFEEQATIVMDHLKEIVETAGSTMDHLLKVSVWLKSQSDQATFDKGVPALLHLTGDDARTDAVAGGRHAARLRARGRGDRLCAGAVIGSALTVAVTRLPAARRSVEISS